MKTLLIPIVLLFMFGCSDKTDTEQYSVDSNFHQFLYSLDKYTPTGVSIFSGDDALINNPIHIVADQFGRAIIVDAPDWSLNLVDIDGNLIFKTGGEGKGPGEYKGINHIELVNGNKLSVLDKKLKRVTFYSITEDSLVFEKIVQLPNYAPLSLTSIHASAGNNYFGVFKKLGHSPDGNEQSNLFKVYKLDANWRLINKLFEIPGNEQLTIDNYHIDHELGLMSHWEVLNNKFSYARSDELKVHSIDLTSESKEQIIFDKEIPEYKNNPKARQFISEKVGPLIQMYPDLESQILEMETLPYFLKFTATDTYFYMSIFNPGIAKTGKVLQIHRKTETPTVIEVPQSFYLFSATKKRLYGIIRKQDAGNNVAIIEL